MDSVRVVWRLLLVAGLGIGPAVPVGSARSGGEVVIPSHGTQPVEQVLVAPGTPGNPVVHATKRDSLVNDINGNLLPDPGDTLGYTVVLSNSGNADAQGVVFSDTLDVNTTLTGTPRASPLARADIYTATTDTALVIGAGLGVLANDFGQPAPTAVPQSAAPTAHGGLVTMNANGNFTYNPPAGYAGLDSFSYQATNSAGIDTGLVSIHVFALPLAVNDSGYSTVQNTPLVVPAGTGVLANDTPNGAVISAHAANTAHGGTVSLALDGSFVYTPTSGFFSPPTDTFTYTLSNAVGSSTATVSITVNLPGPPVAVSDAYTATANTHLNVPAAGVLANDTVNSASISSYQATTSQGGTVVLAANGSFAYTPTTNYISPPADTFTYTLTNLIGSSTATVTVTVQPPGPPLAVDDNYTTTANTPLTVPADGVLGNDTVNFAVISGYAATTTHGGAVALNLDGSFTYTPPTNFVSAPTDTFTYTLTNDLGSNTAIVSVTVQPPGPPVAVDDAYTATVNTPLTVPAAGVLGNDTVNFATIASFAATTSQGGHISLNADGGFSYTPTTDLVSPPVDTFTYTLSNLLGNSTATATITVYPAGPPVTVDDTYTATANTPLHVPAAGVLGNDTLNSGVIADYQASTAHGGSVTLNANGGFVYTPTHDFISPPVDTFTYTVTNTVGSSSALVTISVQPAGPPLALDDSYTTSANTPLTVTAGSGILNNDTLNFAVISGYQAATSQGGTVALAADGSFVYTPPADTLSPPTDAFTYTLTNTLGSSTATVSLNIAPPGVPVATDDTYTATLNMQRSIAAPGVLGNDLRNFGAITGYAAATSRGGSVILAGSGAFTYTPPSGVVSPPDDTFTYTLSNALGNSTATVNVVIYPAAPPVAADDLYTTTANTVLNVPATGVLGNDTQNFGVIANYAATTVRGGSVILAATGAFTYTPPANTVRPPLDSFTYTLTNTLGSSTATVSLALDPPGPPLAVDDAYTATASAVLQAPAAGVLGNDTTNFATITDFQASSARGGTVVIDASGAFTFTAPAAVSPPDDTFTYTLGNALGNSTATVTIQLFPPAPPVAVNDSYTATVNIPRSFAAGAGVLANDTANFGTVSAYQANATLGGTVIVAASGAFTYTPPADTISPPGDTFTYTVSNALGADTATATITIFPPPPVAVNDSYTATGNITLTVPISGVLSNDVLNFATLSAASSNSAQGGNVVVNADGSFSYISAPGFKGTDTFTYTLSNTTASDTATVTVTVSNTVWFVDNSAGPGDGRLGSPYNSLSPLQGVDLDVPGDVIFVYDGIGSYGGGLVLENNQALIGQGVDLASALASLGISLAPNSAPLPGVASNPTITNATGPGVTLASSNTIRGVNLGTAGAGSFALLGSSFGTLSVLTSTINSGAGGLSLTTGAANVTLASLTSTAGPNAVYLNGVGGTLNLGDGAMSGATGATMSVGGGTASLTYSGDLTQANNAPLVSVSGGHTSGTLTFQTGTLSASNGTGLQFDNADGTYNFNGTNTLNGGDAGVDILNGSAGTFSFSTNTSVTNPSGTAFNLDASPANVTYSGSLSANSGFLVDINNHSGGTVTFQTGTLNSTGHGIRVQNSHGGTINFDNTTKTLTTGSNAAITLSSNSGATINFNNGGLAVATTSGGGFSATGGGTVNVLGANNALTSTTGTTALLSGVGGTLLFRSLSANGASNGVSLNNTTGSFEVTGDGASDPANTTRGRTTAKSGGGTLTLGSGGTVVGTTGAAILLSNAANVTLRNMTLATSGAGGAVNDGRDGIRASNSSNLTLDNLRLDGSGNGLANNSALDGSGLANLTIIHSEMLNAATASGVETPDVWGVGLTNLTGTASVSHSIFDTARENVFGVVETGSSAVSLAVTNSLFQHAAIAGVGNDGLGITANNTSQVSLTVDGSTFLHFYGNGIQYTGTDQSGGGLITIKNSTFDDDGSSINIAHQGQGKTVQFNIKNNHIRDSGVVPGVPGNALNAVNLLLASQSDVNSKLEGYLTGNTIGNASLTDSGSAQGVGVYAATYGAGTLTISASGNTIRQIQQDNAFWAYASKQSATTGVGTINLTLSGNDFATSQTSGIALAGLGITAGAGAFAGDSPTICANLLGNTEFRGDPGYLGIDLTMVGTSPTVKLVGYGGAQNDDAAVNTFLNSAAVATTVAPPGAITRAAGDVMSTASCPAPSFAQGSVQASHVLAAVRPDRLAGLASPAAGLPSGATRGQGALATAGTVPLNIGVLPAGKAVTITFDVAIMKPVPPGTTQVSNQAHISGSNFAAVLSDDPDTPAPNDPTITLLAPPERTTIYLPLVANNFAAGPDLVGSFSLSPNQRTYSAGQPVTITAVITNAGTAPASGFWVDFYLNPSSPPTHANQVWDTLCGLSPCYGIAWRVDTGLAPGQSITLTSTPGSYWAPNTIWPGHFAGGTTDLYMYVDSFSNPSDPNGAVQESNESNNRSELHGLNVPGAAGPQGDDVRRPQDLPAR